MGQHAPTHDPCDPSKKVTHLTHWPMTHRPIATIACSSTQQFRRDKLWRLEIKFLNISKFSPRHGTHYFTWPASPRIPTHTVTSSSLSDTPNCVPWREPFVVPVRGLLIFHLHIPYADKQSAVYQLTLFCVVCVCDSREWWALRFTQSRPRLRILIEPSRRS